MEADLFFCIGCGPLDPPRNGSVLLDDASGAIYFCDEGFQLIGSSERRCLGCGGGKWTGAKPFCVKPGTFIRRSYREIFSKPYFRAREVDWSSSGYPS